MKSGRLLFITVLAASLAAGLARAQPTDAEKNAKTEKTIAALLVDKLGKDAEPIKVSAIGDKVTLTGQVTQKSTQEIAQEVALSVEGVDKVDNQVKVKDEKGLFHGKAKKEAADSKLENAVEKKVKAEIGAHYKTISIECTEGFCSIRGSVPDQARKDLALKTAASVEGVKKVVDLLKIKS